MVLSLPSRVPSASKGPPLHRGALCAVVGAGVGRGAAVAEAQHGQNLVRRLKEELPAIAEPTIPHWKCLSAQLMPEVQSFMGTTDFLGSFGIQVC